ncbi:predicted protein [Methanosarcina acetivorans C2A]|uniref:Uncharacterized protein n=1 Tax=Methanosarcina acetivorans (strain ATCC 35395 / DSM 2834 / JCM 12185 / C2A) TaxID=188937 RepID=Q8TMM0_METAC|nr:predicted protein [Methanosarcina acetivorans C2A]
MAAHHTDEPQEGDPGEWHYAQAQGYGLCLLLQPEAAAGRIGGNREPDEHIGGDMQHGKEDTGDGCNTRRLESQVIQGTYFFVHYFLLKTGSVSLTVI